MVRLVCIQTFGLEGHSGSRVDDSGPVADDFFDAILQERVVGAAEHDVVGALVEHRPDVAAQQGGDLLRVKISPLHSLHKAFADAFDDLHVTFECGQRLEVERALERACRCEDSDDSAARLQDCRLDGRLHPYERHLILSPQVLDGSSRCSVACHDDYVSTLFQQKVGNLPRTLPDESRLLRAVWAVAAVAEIDILLGGHQLAELLVQDGAVKLAMGNSDVPVGQYTQKILAYYDINEEEIANNLTYGSNVKEVTSQVSEATVDCGIVYATDAFSAGLEHVDEATKDMCGQVIYPAAVLNVTKNEDAARAFMDFIMSAEASEVFESVGFTALN